MVKYLLFANCTGLTLMVLPAVSAAQSYDPCPACVNGQCFQGPGVSEFRSFPQFAYAGSNPYAFGFQPQQQPGIIQLDVAPRFYYQPQASGCNGASVSRGKGRESRANFSFRSRSRAGCVNCGCQ